MKPPPLPPPPLPTARSDQRVPALPPNPPPDREKFIRDIKTCSTISYVVGIFGVVGFACCLIALALQWIGLISAGEIGYFELALCSPPAFLGLFGGAKLAGFKKQGENAAFIAFILFLFLVPLGTVLGIIGLNKLQKARVILE